MESTENTEFFSVPSVVNVTLDYLSPYTLARTID